MCRLRRHQMSLSKNQSKGSRRQKFIRLCNLSGKKFAVCLCDSDALCCFTAKFDNGNYLKAIEIAKTGIEKARKTKANLLISRGLDIIASSQISLEKYSEAAYTLNEALQEISENETSAYQKSLIYIRFAWLFRSQRKFAEALDYSKKALAFAPNNRHIQREYYLNIGRILFSSGYDISAIIWLEKAEKLLELEINSAARLDIYRFLTLAWSSRLNYQAALNSTLSD